ncbi:hypothetical protein [Paracoccus sp. KR1-242]|uniref:hypothetical protein n=1 Tax=Paracoccus sp. KR1-242 TaxID=3410028 RepID=UPI003C0BDFA6
MFLLDDLFVEGLAAGAGGAPTAPRPVLQNGDPASFSAHSLLANPLGYCAAMWSIGLHVNYLGFSNIEERWNSEGVDRTAAPTKTLWVTDFADFDTGAWLPNSAEGIRALQYHYWFALTAQANGAESYVLYPPWATENMDASFDPPLLETYEFNARWLAARPEITIPVYWFPTPVIVRAFRDRYAGQGSIYQDGLHLKNDTDAAPGQFCQVALGHAFWVMLTGQRHDTTVLDPEAVALIDIACSAVEDYACTGFGGSIHVTPWAGADPLPDPAPLPD